MLSRLTYLSDSNSLITWDLVKQILSVAQENNKSLNVTGMLVSHGMNFLQTLEGEKDEIEDLLFQHIAQDKRHGNIQLLEISAIPCRIFADWSMKGFDFDLLEEKQQNMILKKYCDGEEFFKMPSNSEHCLDLIHELGFMH